MTMLETRQPNFPANPEDGFQIKEPLEDGYIIWTYSEQFNEWTYEVFRGALDGFIYTDQVRTRGEDVPAPSKTEPVLFTQRDVNHYLDRVSGNLPPQKVLEVERIKPPEGIGMTTYDGSTNHPSSIQTRTSVEAKLESHVTKQEFTQSQAEQDLEISKLEDKLDEVEGKVGHGKWKYDSVNTNPRPGDFNLLGANSIPTGQWADVVAIKFSAEDALGHEYNFHRAVEGDVIKLGYELGPEVSYAEFQVTPGGNGVFGVVRLLGHEGTARADWRYDVEHFSSFDPAGVATQTYVDAGDQGVKDYVDERINAISEEAINEALSAPAFRRYKVTTSSTSQPSTGRVSAASTNMKGDIRISLTSLNGTRIANIEHGKNLYIRDGNNGSTLTISCYAKVDGKWVWMGHGDISHITAYNSYLLVSTVNDRRWENGEFVNGNEYYFTIPGLF